MFHVVLFICDSCEKEEESGTGERLTARGDIASTQSKATLCANEVETTEVVPLAKGLLLSIWAIYGEKLRGDNITTILYRSSRLRGSVYTMDTYEAFETVEVENGAECTDECALHGEPARGAWSAGRR